MHAKKVSTRPVVNRLSRLYEQADELVSEVFAYKMKPSAEGRAQISASRCIFI